MLQNAMLIGLGFLTAALIALLAAPLFWRRAVSLTTSHIRARSPLTMSEIQADRDQLRAEYALKTRKLEVSLDQMKDKSSAHKVALSSKAEEVSDLSDTVEQQASDISQRDDKIVALSEHISSLENHELVPAPGRPKGKVGAGQKNTGARKVNGRHRIEPSFKAPVTSEQVDIDPALIEQFHTEIFGIIDEMSQITEQQKELDAERRSLDASQKKPKRSKTGAKAGNKQNHMKQTALEAKRARLLADLTGLEQRIAQSTRRLEKENTEWLRQSNPFGGLMEKIETLQGQTLDLTTSLSKNAPVSEADGNKDTDTKQSVAPEKTSKKSEKKRAERSGAIPTLADRIRALQKQVAQ